MPEAYVKGTIRISLGKNNTAKEVQKIVGALGKIIYRRECVEEKLYYLIDKNGKPYENLTRQRMEKYRMCIAVVKQRNQYIGFVLN